jgi:hypothetical protein
LTGITSYGVSMTTLEEVFLSLEGENAEETEVVEGVSSVKLVRARALSRSLSLQSKTLSYQVRISSPSALCPYCWGISLPWIIQENWP